MGLEFAKEPFVVRSILEVAAAAEHQRLIDGSLESVMALLGVSILMGLAGVDGLSFQAVVGQEGAITLLEQITIAKVIHRGAEPIGTVHLGNSSQFPEGVLEPLAEALETLGKADCGSCQQLSESEPFSQSHLSHSAIPQSRAMAFSVCFFQDFLQKTLDDRWS